MFREFEGPVIKSIHHPDCQPGIEFVDPRQTEYDLQTLDISHVKGGGKKHRGNHRMETKGVGLVAFFRNNWMKSISG